MGLDRDALAQAFVPGHREADAEEEPAVFHSERGPNRSCDRASLQRLN
jgi:hypothetical protein